MITIEKHKQIQRLLKENNVEDMQADMQTVQAELLAIYADTDADVIMSYPLTKYHKLVEKFYNDYFTDFSKAEPAIKDKYTAGDMVLIPMLDFTQITVAQMMDFSVLSVDPIENIEKLLAIFLIPKGKKYNDGYDLMEVQKAILKMDFNEVSPLLAFFLRWFTGCRNHIQISCLEEVRKQTKKIMKLEKRIQKRKKKGRKLIKNPSNPN